MEKKVRIVQMVPALGWGGAQVFCIQLCNQLAKYPGYEVILVSMYHHNPAKHLPLHMLDPNIRFITLGKRPGPDPRMFVRIYNTLKELRPDVVHTHLHSGYYCFMAYTRIKDYTYRRIHTFHNLVKKDAPWYGRLAYRYFFSKGIMQPVSISDEVHKSALETYHNCKIVQINNGSDPVQPTENFAEAKKEIDNLKKDAGTKVVINIARVSKQKNQQLLLACMKTLEAEGENVIAIILGGHVPEDQKLYDSLVAQQPGNVFFLGRRENARDYLLCSDAFVLSSIFEGLPISLLEAMSAGVVPVCTPVGGLINIITPETGFLSADVGYESYLAALKAWLHTPAERLAQLVQNGKQLYQDEFSMESCAAKYNALYGKQ